MIVGENFNPGDVVQIVTDDERVFSIRIPETANPTFRDFLDSCTPTPYNSDPDEVAELLMEFAEIMDEMLNSRLSFTYCKQPGRCDYPYCDCGTPFQSKSFSELLGHLSEEFRKDPCCIDYEDDLYNGENVTLDNAQNVTIYADNVYMDGE